MKIKCFEEIESWQEARKLACTLYALSDSERFKRDFGLSDQLRRAAVSVMSNIAEGFDSGSNLEFIRFLGYSRRSASEVQSHLYVALDQKYIDEVQFREAYKQSEKTRRFITAFIRYLKGSGSSMNTKTRKHANTKTK
jgi:four helix bundle protein